MAIEMLVGGSLLSKGAPMGMMIPSPGQILGLSSWEAEDQEVVCESACRDVVVLGESLVTSFLTFWSKYTRLGSSHEKWKKGDYSQDSVHLLKWQEELNCVSLQQRYARFCLIPHSPLLTSGSEEYETIFCCVLVILLRKVWICKGWLALVYLDLVFWVSPPASGGRLCPCFLLGFWVTGVF